MSNAISITCIEPVQGHKSIQARHFGRTPEQKIRASIGNARRYAENKEKIKKQVSEYRAANPEKVKACGKAYTEKNKENISNYQSAYRRNKRQENREYAKKYRMENPGKAKAAVDAWYAANPGAYTAKSQNRRSRLKSGGRLSHGIVKKLLILQRGKCANCRCDLSKHGRHIDHVIPISKGGLNIDLNVQLLCPPCNMAKSAKNPIEWAQENGRLL